MLSTLRAGRIRNYAYRAIYQRRTPAQEATCLSVERACAESLRAAGALSGRGMLALVSGGADSVALLYALAAIRDAGEPLGRLEVLHFDHRRRGAAVAAKEEVSTLFLEDGLTKSLVPRKADASHAPATLTFSGGKALVCAHAAALGVTAQVIRWPQERQSCSHAEARAWRYSHARRVALAQGVHHIATAHHLDDQVETVLLKMVRGVALPNVQAMQLRSSNGVVRPLLALRKRQLLAWLQAPQRRVCWCEDASNTRPDAGTRNAVRLRLVPLLKELCGGERALLARLDEAVEQSGMLRLELDGRLEGFDSSDAALDVRAWRALSGELTRLDALYTFVAEGMAPVATPSYAAVRALMRMLEGCPPDVHSPSGSLVLAGGAVATDCERPQRGPSGRWQRSLPSGFVAECSGGHLRIWHGRVTS